MPTLKVKTNDTTITHGPEGEICVKISKQKNNGLSIEDGKIKITKGFGGNPGSVGSVNFPGNGIYSAMVNVGIGTLRANFTVSRIAGGDPTVANEGTLMTGPDGIIDRIKKGTWG